jgi:hypothetical protein
MIFSVNYWLRGHSTESVGKDYVLGGNLETISDSEAIYKVVMKLQVKVQKLSDFGIYKCIAKNALGNAEEIVRILRKLKTIKNWKSISCVTLNENKSYFRACFIFIRYTLPCFATSKKHEENFKVD